MNKMLSVSLCQGLVRFCADYRIKPHEACIFRLKNKSTKVILKIRVTLVKGINQISYDTS